MKPWGVHDPDKSPHQALMEYALTFLASDEIRLAGIVRSFGRSLVRGGELSGEPYWEIEHISEAGGDGSFRLYADETFSGVAPEEDRYTTGEIFAGLEAALTALAERGPRTSASAQDRLDYAAQCRAAIASLPEYRKRLGEDGA